MVYWLMIFAAVASWLVYRGWRPLWRVFGLGRNYDFATAFPFNWGKPPNLTPNSQPVPLLNLSPDIQLPRLYPIFPADGLKGDTIIDIIAVHGIETISPRTWTAYEQDTEPKGRPCNWLKDADMLPSVIKGARIWAFDYNSNYSHDAQTVRIDGLAVALLNFIKDRHEDFKSRKTVFIGSCFGGIVIAEALLIASRESDKRAKATFNQTAGVIFLGSPLRGTQAATFAGWKNFICGILDSNQESSSALLDDLVASSSRLESLVTEFGKITVRNGKQPGMEIRCFYETRKTQLVNLISRKFPVKPKEILLVDRASACLDCHERIPLDVRHAKMNKYRGPEDPNFKLVSGRIKDIVDKICTDQQLTREDQECMQALSYNYQDQKDVNPERVKGTCNWFLEHPKFLAWRNKTAADLLWVTAGPGCGKSVLSKALVDEGLLNPDNPDTETTSICYYFFKDDTERGSGINALRSILHQLYKQKPWLIKHAIQDYKTNGRNFSFGKLWDILKKTVSDANSGPVICVFDALDECETSTRKSLIKHICEIHRASNTVSAKLKFLITSRPYHELSINFAVDDLPSIHLDGNMMSEAISKEIDLVIEHEISRIGNARHLDSKTQASLIENLKIQNNRTYLWVYLMLQEILISLESTEWKLTQLLKSIPTSVHDAYEKILERATDPTQAQRVLCLILAADRPLTLKEMNIALEILTMKANGQKCNSEANLNLDKEEAFQNKIENLCGLFISIVDKKIYLIHQTAKEFLIAESGKTNHWTPSCWKYTFTLQTSHLEVLKACIGYLQLDFQDSGINSLKNDQLDQDYPWILYASIKWTFHFREAGDKVNKELRENALQFCNTKTEEFSLWFNIFKESKSIFESLPRNTSSLIIASYFGLVAVVQVLLERNDDININATHNRDGRTPLWWAVKNGQEAVVKLLLDKGADIETKGKYSWTPLWWAVKNGHEAIVKLLLDRGADIETKDEDSRTPLWWAAYRGHEAVVKLLLDRGADIETKDKHGWTPLWSAAYRGHEAVVKLLLDRGADIETKDEDGRTPLWSATYRGHEAVVKLLLDRGADIETKDKHGWTPLWSAAYNGHEAVVKLLLDRGADIEIKDKHGWTPLWSAANNGHEAVVKLLLDRGADIEMKDKYGQTPLLRAAYGGRGAVIKLLLDRGADIETHDIRYRTPLKWATKKGRKAVIKLLLDRGANMDVKIEDEDDYSLGLLFEQVS